MELPQEGCPIPTVNAASAEVVDLLKTAKTIAVVGLSPKSWRPSHGVSKYMQARGYRILPVRPGCAELLGEPCVASLDEVREPIDIVDVFRASEHVPGIVEAAIRAGARAVWLQEGVVHNEAAERARAAGLLVVQNKCILKVHRALV